MGQAWRNPVSDPKLACMKLCLVIALTIARALVARADSFSLGAHGSLLVSIPASWVARNSAPPGMPGCDIKILSRNGAKAACRITVVYSGGKEMMNKEKARAALLKIAEPFVDVSVEKKAVVKDFSLKSGFGIYCSFTNAELVGKPSSMNQTISPGVIYLSKDVSIAATIFSDDLSGHEFQELLGVIQSIQLIPPSTIY
jgi:hypothetical protein